MDHYVKIAQEKSLEVKSKWEGLEYTDKLVTGSAAALALGGGVVSLITWNPKTFAICASIGALSVFVRVLTKPEPTQVATAPPSSSGSCTSGCKTHKTIEPAAAGLGAPWHEPADQGVVTTFAGPVTRQEAEDVPRMWRVPVADVRTDPLDDRIRSQVVPPLGPYVGDRGGFW